MHTKGKAERCTVLKPKQKLGAFWFFSKLVHSSSGNLSKFYFATLKWWKYFELFRTWSVTSLITNVFFKSARITNNSGFIYTWTVIVYWRRHQLEQHASPKSSELALPRREQFCNEAFLSPSFLSYPFLFWEWLADRFDKNTMIFIYNLQDRAHGWYHFVKSNIDPDSWKCKTWKTTSANSKTWAVQSIFNVRFL